MPLKTGQSSCVAPVANLSSIGRLAIVLNGALFGNMTGGHVEVGKKMRGIFIIRMGKLFREV
jgi:hypothetical protein